MWTRRAIIGSGLALGAGLLLPHRALAATDQLRIGLASEPPQLDPTAGNDPSTEAVAYRNIFEGLTLIDEDGKVQPGLAKSWTVSPDDLAYTFTLQTEARYHDGTDFDAQHVVFSLERITAAASQNPGKARYASIASTAAVDGATVKITLKQPDPDLLFNLGRAEAVMVAPESADNNRSVPLGTGPFAFLQWDGGADIVVVRNEDYWGTHPRVDQATFVFIADPAAAIDALIAGQIDGFPNFPAAGPLDRIKDNPAFQIVTGTGPEKQPRTGIWASKLSGMWRNAPLESCVLAGLRWADDNGGAQPAPLLDQSTDD